MSWPIGWMAVGAAWSKHHRQAKQRSFWTGQPRRRKRPATRRPRGTPTTVTWKLNGRTRSRRFATKAEAQRFAAELRRRHAAR